MNDTGQLISIVVVCACLLAYGVYLVREFYRWRQLKKQREYFKALITKALTPQKKAGGNNNAATAKTKRAG